MIRSAARHAPIALLVLLASASATLHALECRPISGLAPLLLGGSTLLLGEMHGVAESPGFAGEAACHALVAGLSVTLALELPSAEDSALQRFLASDGGPAARAGLAKSAFWSKPYQDGRASLARLALLERVRAWRRAGRPIDVLSFDRDVPAGAAGPPGAAREQAMAEALDEVIRKAPERLMIVLVGNVHSRVAVGVPWDATYEPMGLRLQRLLPARPITALDVAYAGGTAWTCTSAEASSCAERALHGASDGARDRVRMFDGVRNGHNGVYDVGSLTASRPAVATAPLVGT